MTAEIKRITWSDGCEIPACDFFDIAERHVESLTQDDFGECIYEYLRDIGKRETVKKLEANETIEVTGYSLAAVKPSESWNCGPVAVIKVHIADWLAANPEDREGLFL